MMAVFGMAQGFGRRDFMLFQAQIITRLRPTMQLVDAASCGVIDESLFQR
jgi:hypothetical protein